MTVALGAVVVVVLAGCADATARQGSAEQVLAADAQSSGVPSPVDSASGTSSASATRGGGSTSAGGSAGAQGSTSSAPAGQSTNGQGVASSTTPSQRASASRGGSTAPGVALPSRSPSAPPTRSPSPTPTSPPSTSGGGGGGGGSKADTIKVSKCYTNATAKTGGELLIKASSSDPSAHLFAYRRDGSLIGEVQNGGGSRYGGTVMPYQKYDPGEITITSSSGGHIAVRTGPFRL
jgi:hypothetical protein